LRSKSDEMLIAACIAVASIAALLPLFVSYCGAMLASAERLSLSDRVTALVAGDQTEPGADDFDRLLQLVGLCPECQADRAGVRAVTLYYRGLELSRRLFGKMSPRLAAWAEGQLRICAHFAAVVLDRSISSSRRLFTREAGDLL
jgi:hypothetical protein